MSERDRTRREFLIGLARGAAYTAPVIASFTVAPDLLAQQGSPPGQMHHDAHHAAAQPEPRPDRPGAEPPSEIHRPDRPQPSDRDDG